MAEKTAAVTFFSLRKDIEQRKFRPVYLLQGDEPYYIDQLSDLIVCTALSDDQRDFNLSIFYGNDADVREVIATCKQYPAFSDYKVVVLREAQLVAKQAGHKTDLELLKLYAEKPLKSTILVVCNKGGATATKGLADTLRKLGPEHGIVFTSAKVREGRDLQNTVKNYAASIGCTIDDKSTAMISDFIGNDLARMFGEIDKLKIVISPNTAITPEHIERNIGISKDFNNFELQDALAARNALKAYRIVNYFERNPKNNPVVVTVATLFAFFSKLLLYSACNDRSQAALMEATGSKSPWQLSKLEAASRQYSLRATVNIITYLRECDVKSKGIGSRQDAYALLRELVYKILHAA